MAKTAASAGIALLATLGLATDAIAAPTVDRVFDGTGTVVAFRITDTASTANTIFLDKGLSADTLEFFSVVGGDITLTAGAMGLGCSKPSNTSVSCPRLVAGRAMRMEVHAGPLDDDVSVGAAVTVGVDLFGEDGADTLAGGAGDDFISRAPASTSRRAVPAATGSPSTTAVPAPWRSTSAWAGVQSTVARTTRGSRTSPGRRSATRSWATPGPTTSTGSAVRTRWTGSSGTT